MKKRLLLSILLFALVFLGMQKYDVMARTYQGNGYTLTYKTDGKSVKISRCSPDAKAVVIPSKIDGCKVVSIGKCAFWSIDSLTSITIPNTVTSIGECAFEFCSSLTSVNIPSSVTSIRNGTFAECSSLTSITIPNSVTRIREHAFENCTSLTSVTIPDSVTFIGDEAFYECTSLTSITIPASADLQARAFGLYFSLKSGTDKPIKGFVAYVHKDTEGEKYCDEYGITKVVSAHKYNSANKCSICGKHKPFIKLSKTKVTLKKKKSVKIKVRYAKGDSVKSWKSSNKKVATVTKKGKITARKKGKATITVTLNSGKKATVKVTVK